ncbi:MAG: DUF58 domain-containing protein [Phycisphaeraceae bacterium]|nr:DUF58 domain-containing protein [Phycisphaeraceae bacterium]
MKIKPAQSIKRLKTAVHLTPSGRAMVMSTGFVLLAAAIIPALGVFACLLTTLACAFVFGLIFKPRVNIGTTLPDQISAGSEVTVLYRVENTSASHSFCLSLSLTDLPAGWLYAGPALIIPHLKPMSTEILQVTLRPTRRGLFTLPCPACYSSFPFHLFSFNVASGPDAKITVLPAYDYIQLDAMSRISSYQYAGSGASLDPSHLPEYAGNRPFLPGDSLRHIDSRAWARLAEPVVKEYHNDMRRHCALWIKDHRTPVPATSDLDRDFEAAISLCASIAYSFGHNTIVDTLVIGQTQHDLRSFNVEMRLGCILTSLAQSMPAPKPQDRLPVMAPCLPLVSSVYALYLGPHDAMEPDRNALEHAGVEFHTLHVSQTPDLEAWTASDSERHWEIDTNAILENQISLL